MVLVVKLCDVLYDLMSRYCTTCNACLLISASENVKYLLVRLRQLYGAMQKLTFYLNFTKTVFCMRQ